MTEHRAKDSVESPLFEDRTPVSAAIQLGIVLAWAAECELATLEWIESRKSYPKHERDRHREIAWTLVYHCADMKVPPRGLLGRPCPRLAEALQLPTQVILDRMSAQ